MAYHIEPITNDNRRPGMPQEGYLVRYGLSDYGWLQTHICKTEEEANTFAKSLEEKEEH